MSHQRHERKAACRGGPPPQRSPAYESLPHSAPRRVPVLRRHGRRRPPPRRRSACAPSRTASARAVREGFERRRRGIPRPCGALHRPGTRRAGGRFRSAQETARHSQYAVRGMRFGRRPASRSAVRGEWPPADFRGPPACGVAGPHEKCLAGGQPGRECGSTRSTVSAGGGPPDPSTTRTPPDHVDIGIWRARRSRTGCRQHAAGAGRPIPGPRSTRAPHRGRSRGAPPC